MTLLDLIKMTILPSGATNSIAQFVKIAFKILSDHLHNWAEFFLDNIDIKRPKTTYNNQKLVSKIWRYMIKHIQNLDAVLANLERASITIARVKSQFYYSGIKIIGYICDSEGRYLDTSKVLKILD